MYSGIFQNPTIRLLSLVQLIAYFGAWFSNVAIYTLILQFGVSPIVNALVVAMYALPAIILAPMSGAIVDKLPFKKFMLTLLGVELTMTLCYLLITDITDVWLLMLLIFIRMSAASLFFTAEMSLLPQVVKGEDLKRANELHSIIWSVTFAMGMALGGLATDWVGPHRVFLIDAALFLVAMIIFSKIALEVVPKPHEKILSMIKDGFHYIRKHHIVLHLMLLHSAVALTSIDALVNLLTDFHYKYVIAIPLAIGWINGLRAVALMIGPFVIGKMINAQNLYKLLLLQGIAYIGWAFVQKDFYLSLVSMLFVGFFTTTLWSYTYTLIQEHTEQRFLGRIVAYNDMIFMTVSIITTLFIGTAFKIGLPLWAITVVIGFGFVAASIYAYRLRPRFESVSESKGN